MGGGKETPRQKMVGLMYLVLMALLAMNVSKAVLDAFIAIEENVQKSCTTQLVRGNQAIDDLKGELTDKTNPGKVEKVKYFLKICEDIDKLAAEQIKFIDEIKFNILEHSGEEMTVADKNPEKVIWKKYDAANPLQPARINLMACQAKDQYDVPMHVIVGEDLKHVTGEGKKLWENYIAYRGKICETLATYKAGDKQFSLKTTPMNDFVDPSELTPRIDKMIKAGKVSPDDVEVIKQLYSELSKPEKVDNAEEKGLHWIGKTFDHSPLVAAVASLSSLQFEVLSARATALNHIKGKVTTGEYSFNKVMALAYAPSSANQGEEFEVKVMMAAFDSDKQPIVTCSGGTVDKANSKDGYGVVKAKASAGPEMTLKGTVTILKKDGSPKTENWETKVVVTKPQGTVSLPDLAVLYRGYPNKVVGVASGYEETILNGQNVSLAKKGDYYIGTPGSGRECSITVSGKNKVANKNVQLGTFKFKVSSLPAPGVYLGGLANGMSAGKAAIASQTRLFAKYPPEIPLTADFGVDTWELSVTGAPRTVSGKGQALTPEALTLLKNVRPGNKVSLLVKYKGMGTSGMSSCVVSVQ